jgi:hypothetical protein
MHLVSETFPLLVLVLPQRFDAEAVQRMAELYEPYFARSERYAVVSLQPPGSEAPGPAERKLITEWVDSPRVRRLTEQLCVASATVVSNPIARGALTAMLWVWKPATPVQPVSNLDEGVNHCLNKLRLAEVPIPLAEPRLRMTIKYAVAAHIKAVATPAESMMDLPATMDRDLTRTPKN